MQPDTNELLKRFKSFLWRLGAYALVGLVAFVSDNLGLFDLPPAVATVAALLLGELTKYLNNRGITVAGKKFGGRK